MGPWKRRLVFACLLMAELLYPVFGATPEATIIHTVVSTDDSSSGNKKSEEVITLTSRNFDSNVTDGSLWLIEMYAPWCGHCMRFAASYEEVARKVHGKNEERKENGERPVKVGKVNGAKETAVNSRFGVSAYPTFFLVDGWNVYEFDNDRTVSKLIKFAEGGYKESSAFPILTSPMGPIGRMQGLFLRFAMWGVSIFEALSGDFGPMMAGIILCGGFVLTSMFGMIALALAITPKTKID